MSLVASEIADELVAYAEQLRSAQKRIYAAPWSDWPDGYTSCHAYPVVYALWSSAVEETPLYVGHTNDLGKRLYTHFKSSGWTRRPTHVSFLESNRFESAGYRTLVERFLIVTLDPSDNDQSR